MFKRLTWMAVGMVAGLGASKWVEHKARQQLARYLPGGRLTLEAGAEMRARARSMARGRVGDVRRAVSEGRAAMAERQEELRNQLGRGPSGQSGSRRGAASARRSLPGPS
ncbi:MAG TPA: hypothetical protein VME46_16170 [Acidimicrobiales bacterium]|nr:hypothetical protein [Acidimicrobiales bacterium]